MSRPWAGCTSPRTAVQRAPAIPRVPALRLRLFRVNDHVAPCGCRRRPARLIEGRGAGTPIAPRRPASRPGRSAVSWRLRGTLSWMATRPRRTWRPLRRPGSATGAPVILSAANGLTRRGRPGRTGSRGRRPASATVQGRHPGRGSSERRGARGRLRRSAWQARSCRDWDEAPCASVTGPRPDNSSSVSSTWRASACSLDCGDSMRPDLFRPLLVSMRDGALNGNP